MPVSFRDLQDAFDFVSSGGLGEAEAFLDRQSGKIYLRSDLAGDLDELPDDIEDEKYVSIPHKRDLDLGKVLVMDFVEQFLPDDYGKVRDFFSRRGAYARFKDLLTQRDALDRWYDFEAKAAEAALREWCADNDVELAD
jgi:hypothetical protein